MVVYQTYEHSFLEIDKEAYRGYLSFNNENQKMPLVPQKKKNRKVLPKQKKPRRKKIKVQSL